MVKMFSRIVSAAAVLSILFSCSKAEIAGPGRNENVNGGPSVTGTHRTLEASIDSELSRVSLDGFAVSWAPGDAMGVVCSDGVIHKFTTATGGASNVPFTSEDVIDPEVELMYAVYPWTDTFSYTNTASSRGVRMATRLVQDGTISGVPMYCNHRKEGSWTFTVAMSVLKMNIPAGWNVNNIVVHKESKVDDGNQGLGGSDFYVSFYTTDGGERSACSKGDTYEMTINNGGILSGDIYFFVRHSAASDATPEYILRLEREDGKVGFLRKQFSHTLSGGSLYDFGDVSSKVGTWYDTEELEFVISNGTAVQKVFNPAILNTGGSINVKEARVYDGHDLYLRHSTTGEVLSVNTQSLCTIAKSGMRYGVSGSGMVKFPALSGMALIGVETVFGWAGSTESASAYSNGKGSIANLDGTLLDDAAGTTIGTAIGYSTGVYEHSWDLWGRPGSGFKAAARNTSYAYRSTASACIRAIRLKYVGTQQLRADGIYTDIPAARSDEITFRGSFAPRNHTALSQFSAGFEYKVGGAAEWTSVTSEDVAMVDATTYASFSKTVDIAYAPRTDLVVRAWVKVGEGEKQYGQVRDFTRLTLDPRHHEDIAETDPGLASTAFANGTSTDITLAGGYVFNFTVGDDTPAGKTSGGVYGPSNDRFSFNYVSWDLFLPVVSGKWLAGSSVYVVNSSDNKSRMLRIWGKRSKNVTEDYETYSANSADTHTGATSYTEIVPNYQCFAGEAIKFRHDNSGVNHVIRDFVFLFEGFPSE